MSKYTPNLCACGQQPEIRGHDNDVVKQVVCVYCQRRGPARANAEYAVKHWNQQAAAPELLEALRTIQEVVRAARKGKTVFWYHYEPIIAAAIAKAEKD